MDRPHGVRFCYGAQKGALQESGALLDDHGLPRYFRIKLLVLSAASTEDWDEDGGRLRGAETCGSIRVASIRRERTRGRRSRGGYLRYAGVTSHAQILDHLIARYVLDQVSQS